MKRGAAYTGNRRVQANDQIAGGQVFALTAENLPCDAFDQIAPICAPDEFLGHGHAKTSRTEFVWPVMQCVEASAQGAAESKNG